MNRLRECSAGKRGRDLRGFAISPAAAHAAIRDGTRIDEPAAASRPERDASERRPDEPDAYDVLGPIGKSETTVRRLVAAAARTRGATTSHDDVIRDLEAELASIEVPKPEREIEAAKRKVVDATKNEAELRERIASLRGRLRTERELGEPTEETAEALEAAVAELSEVSTDRIAADQALEAAKRDARNARSVRDRRMKLQDRLENRRREARAALVDALFDEFEAIRERVGSLVDEDSDGAIGSKFGGTASQLAAVALADLEVPIVVDAHETDIDDAGRVARILEVDVWLCEE
ncbi:hypothetical protein RH858_06185 [Halalkaliarchaeum sp. AArc-GB]|uniref:DUF7856 family protein n=1 Tax=Halalkaliarchaeum sp. AArc-GB TaxID=3074078 RepID=UPI00285E9328|nr:hypothetical protein [Halalkaliarchaeum sp. AArc-GB]MDR5672737.1 hypothetical protein [Halalkaliarchaeum sp. AArc-GB]